MCPEDSGNVLLISVVITIVTSGAIQAPNDQAKTVLHRCVLSTHVQINLDCPVTLAWWQVLL